MADYKEIIKQTLKEMLEKMDFRANLEISGGDSGLWIVKIQCDEAGFLIGQGGENLAAMQHLARAILNRKAAPDTVSLVIDVNDYRAHRLELLKEMALKMALQVAREKRPRILEPMSPYERRFIHLALKDFLGVKAESRGEGMERRIVISPIDSD